MWYRGVVWVSEHASRATREGQGEEETQARWSAWKFSESRDTDLRTEGGATGLPDICLNAKDRTKSLT